MHNIKNSFLHFELNMLVGEMSFFDENLNQDDNNTSRLQWTIILAVALVILRVTVQGLLQLEIHSDFIMLIIMILIESVHDFLLVAGAMIFGLEFSTLVAGCMIQAHVITEV